MKRNPYRAARIDTLLDYPRHSTMRSRTHVGVIPREIMPRPWVAFDGPPRQSGQGGRTRRIDQAVAQSVQNQPARVDRRARRRARRGPQLIEDSCGRKIGRSVAMRIHSGNALARRSGSLITTSAMVRSRSRGLGKVIARRKRNPRLPTEAHPKPGQIRQRRIDQHHAGDLVGVPAHPLERDHPAERQRAQGVRRRDLASRLRPHRVGDRRQGRRAGDVAMLTRAGQIHPRRPSRSGWSTVVRPKSPQCPDSCASPRIRIQVGSCLTMRASVAPAPHRRQVGGPGDSVCISGGVRSAAGGAAQSRSTARLCGNRLPQILANRKFRRRPASALTVFFGAR